MINIFNQVYTSVKTALTTAYTGITLGRHLPPKEHTFPMFILFPIDNHIYTASLDSSGAENHAVISLQAEAYSDKKTGAEAECDKIMGTADTQLMSLGFVRNYYSFMPASSDELTRLVCRYRAVVSKDNKIFRR